MIKKSMMLMVLTLCVMNAAYVWAENVYTTANGTKYHKADCRLLKNKEKAAQLDKKEAVGNGYVPCKRCYKEDITSVSATGKLTEDKG